MLSALLIHGVPIECINHAAVTYYVPATVIVSVLQTEGGRPGLAKPNKNGTFDYGPMQVNSIWLKRIAPYGYSEQQLRNNPCVNVMVGTWILSHEIVEDQDYWRGIGDYNSHTQQFNQTYQRQVLIHYDHLQKLLDVNHDQKIYK